jgi:hypothetical protein
MSKETEKKKITLGNFNSNLSQVTLFLMLQIAQQIEAKMTIWNFSCLGMKTWNHATNSQLAKRTKAHSQCLRFFQESPKLPEQPTGKEKMIVRFKEIA